MVNAIALRKMKDPSKEFTAIRTQGTLGWIAAGLSIGKLDREKTLSLENTLIMTGAASIFLGLHSFFLPNTPLHKDKNEKIYLKSALGFESLVPLKYRSYVLFFITSVLVSIPLAFYCQHANQFLNELGMEATASKMALGQFSELLFLHVLPFFLKQFGFKLTLIIGLLGWGICYLLFAFGNIETSSWMLFLELSSTGYTMIFSLFRDKFIQMLKQEKNSEVLHKGLLPLPLTV